MELTVRECLLLSPLNRFKVLTGEAGLDNVVKQATIIDSPDSVYWIKGNEFIITTAFAFKDEKQKLFDLVSILANREIAALAIKVNRFILSIPEGLVEHCQSLGVPLLVMPDDCAYRDIFESIYEEIVLRKQGEQRQELYTQYYDKIANHADLTSVADLLSMQIHLPVLLFAKTNQLIYSTKGSGYPIIQPGSPLDLIRDTLSGWHSFQYELDGRGTLVILSQREKLSSELDHVIRNSVVIFVMQWIYDEHKKQVSENEFIYSLLTGELHDEKIVFKNMVQFNLDYAQKYYCLVLTLDDMKEGYGGGTSLLEYSKLLPAHKLLGKLLNQTVKEYDMQAKVIQDTRVIIVLLPTDEKTVSKKSSRVMIHLIKDACNHRLINYNISMGISAGCFELTQSFASYKQAMKALKVGRNVMGCNSVMYYEDLGIYRLLIDIPDKSELEHLYHKTVGILVDYDQANHTDFFHTFETYYQNNFNMKETAAELNLHYNSLQYRLKKISEITELNLNASEDMFSLMVGLKVKSLLKS